VAGLLTKLDKMKKTVLNQLEKWISDHEKVNGIPTMFEIKAQIDMFKEIEKEQIVKAFDEGYENGACVNEGQDIYHGSNYYKLNYESVS
jgi:hypothetical protein